MKHRQRPFGLRTWSIGDVDIFDNRAEYFGNFYFDAAENEWSGYDSFAGELTNIVIAVENLPWRHDT